jgi:integrase
MTRKAKGRANGEGSVFEYPKGSGKWIAQVPLSDGRTRRARAPSQRVARGKLREMQKDVESGVNITSQQPTVTEWCQIWLSTFAINLKPNIKADYAGVIKRYITDTPLGKRKLSQLTPADVQAWINTLAKRVSAQTVRNAHARLHKALVVAVRQRDVVRNVADDVELPSARPPTIQPLDLAQTRAFLAITEGHRLTVLYRLAVNLGMRQAELLGLTWDAIDWQAGTLRVDRQLKRVAGEDDVRSFVLQTTKTRAGERLLQLDEDLLALLRAHRETQTEEAELLGERWGNTLNLVFVGESGAPIHFSNLVQQFKKLLKAAGLPAIRFHDLRHTAATLMLADSVPLVTVSKILGHSSPAVTANIYAHALDDSKAGAIAGLSRRLRGVEKGE